MNTLDIREELLNIIMADVYTKLEANESADNDSNIIITDDDGNRYLIQITAL